MIKQTYDQRHTSFLELRNRFDTVLSYTKSPKIAKESQEGEEVRQAKKRRREEGICLIIYKV